jgi:D-glycero-alpha-D-manno-heptose-7-phosphate kinase
MPDVTSPNVEHRIKDSKKLQCDIIRAKSPLRISFTGGGTDVPAWYEQHPGAVLSSTINRYAYVTLYPREDRQVRIRSLDLGFTVDYDLDSGPAYDGALDLAKVAIRRLGIERGMDIDIRSDAPKGSGLGGSSALTSAILAALAEFRGARLSREALAEMNYTVERIDLEIAGGKQDQYATAYGGFNTIKFCKDLVAVERVEVDESVVNDLEAHLLLCYTGQVRAHGNLVAKQVEMFQQGRTTTIDGMKRLYEMVFEMRDALVDGDLDHFGFLLHESHVNKKRMNPHVTDGTPIDQMYEVAREAGALGGKLLGAGGGGYFIFFVRPFHRYPLIAALEQKGFSCSRIAFEENGLRTWKSRIKT